MVVFVVVFVVVVVVVVDDADVAEAEDLLEIVSVPELFQLLSSEISLHTASLCMLFSVCQAHHTCNIQSKLETGHISDQGPRMTKK